MEKLEMNSILNNDQNIIAAYGQQVSAFDDAQRRLKFIRFKIQGFVNDEIYYNSKYGKTCRGRS